jgi:hypothetical protein
MTTETGTRTGAGPTVLSLDHRSGEEGTRVRRKRKKRKEAEDRGHLLEATTWVS